MIEMPAQYAMPQIGAIVSVMDGRLKIGTLVQTNKPKDGSFQALQRFEQSRELSLLVIRDILAYYWLQPILVNTYDSENHVEQKDIYTEPPVCDPALAKQIGDWLCAAIAEAQIYYARPGWPEHLDRFESAPESYAANVTLLTDEQPHIAVA